MRKFLLLSLLLVALTALVYWPTRQYGFLNYDDTLHVRDNPYLQPPSWERVWYFWRFPFDRTPVPGVAVQAGGNAPPYEVLYAPLAFTMWAGLTYLARDTTVAVAAGQQAPIDASIYHSFSIIIHIFNAVMVLLLVRRLLKNDIAAFGAGVLFALHPLQVEPVSWVTGMNTLLSAFWSLLALNCLVSAMESGAARPENDGVEKENGALPAPGVSWGLYLLATLLYLAAVLSKPASVVLPVMALAIVWMWQPRFLRLAAGLMVPWLAISAISAGINRNMSQADLSDAFIPTMLRPFVVGDALAFYLAKLVLPLQLATDYGRKPGMVISNWWGYVNWLLPVAVTVAVFLWMKKGAKQQPPKAALCRALWAGLLVFFFTLIPTSGVVTYYYHLISTVADRYCYFALIGAGLLFGGLVAIPASASQKKEQWALGGILVLGLCWAGLSYSQVGHWRNNETLWRQTLRINPKSATGWSSLCYLAQAAGDYSKALEYADRGLKEEPKNWKIYYQKAETYRILKEDKLALENYRLALKYNVNFYLARLKWGEMLYQANDLKGASVQYGEALKIRPDDGQTLGRFGVVAGRLGAPKIAEEYLRKALEHGFDPGSAHTFLGVVLAQQGRLEEAMDELNLAMAIDGPLYEAVFNRGLIYEKRNDLKKAEADFLETIRLRPSFTPAYLAVGRLKTRQGALDEARKFYGFALKTDPKNKAAREQLKSLGGL